MSDIVSPVITKTEAIARLVLENLTLRDSLQSSEVRVKELLVTIQQMAEEKERTIPFTFIEELVRSYFLGSIIPLPQEVLAGHNSTSLPVSIECIFDISSLRRGDLDVSVLFKRPNASHGTRFTLQPVPRHGDIAMYPDFRSATYSKPSPVKKRRIKKAKAKPVVLPSATSYIMLPAYCHPREVGESADSVLGTCSVSRPGFPPSRE